MEHNSTGRENRLSAMADGIAAIERLARLVAVVSATRLPILVPGGSIRRGGVMLHGVVCLAVRARHMRGLTEVMAGHRMP